MSRLNGSTEPNTTSILVEGIPFTTIPKNNVVQDNLDASWQQEQKNHPQQLQGSSPEGDRIKSSSEVSSHITAIESAKA